MGNRFREFMSGRYGMDSLGKLNVFVALGLIVLSFFFRNKVGIVLNYVALGLLVWGYLRMFSRNVEKRYAEQERIFGFFRAIGRVFHIGGSRNAHRDPTYRYFACPRCRQTLRVPKGRGKVAITCPKCRTEFIKKT